jgi:hypothetical protein
VPRTIHECKGWDPSPDELRRLANELAEKLPDWSSTVDPSVTLDYAGLKAAAIGLASAPECVQWPVIETFTNEFRGPSKSKLAALSGMFLLMRVLFVLPPDYRGSRAAFTEWNRPMRLESTRTNKWNNQWPVLVNPDEPVLEIERCQNTATGYGAVWELAYFKLDLRFRTRTPAEIEALTIRGRP